MTSITDEERKAKKAAYDREYRKREGQRERHNALARERHRKNPEKERARHRRDYRKHADKARARGRLQSRRHTHRKTAYALRENERRRVAIIGRPIPSVCDICGETPKRPLCADHCHKDGHGRGWLCERCNFALGQVGDDRDLLRKMIAYLTHHAAYQSPQLTLPGF